MMRRLLAWALAAAALTIASLPARAASVDDWLRANGTAQAHAQLQRLGEEHAGWKMLGLLWQQPELIAPAARAMGITTTDQAAQLAQALADTLGMPRAEAFARLANPQPLPGITSTAGMPRTSWADMQAAIKAQTPNNGVGWYAPDASYALPSRAQLEAIAAVQPYQRWLWRETVMDCDDFVQAFRGWLSAHGLGNLAIGYAALQYYTGTTRVGRHAVAIALDDTGTVWLIDPQRPGLHHARTSSLGSPPTATHWHLSFVMH